MREEVVSSLFKLPSINRQQKIKDLVTLTKITVDTAVTTDLTLKKIDFFIEVIIVESSKSMLAEKNEGLKFKDTVNVYSKLLGVSKEGLRFYEQKGLIHPDHDANTGYRIYGGEESAVVGTCKKYRKYGFNLNQVYNLLHQAFAQKILQRFYTQYEVLQKEIEEKKRILSSLWDRTQQLEDTLSLQGQFTVAKRPALYWVPIRQNKILLDQPPCIGKVKLWSTFSPYIDPAFIWSLEKLQGKKGTESLGCMIEAKDVGTFPVKDGYYLPEAKCLYTVNEIEGYANMSDIVFDDILNYMREKGLAPAGDAVARIVCVFIDEENIHHFLSQIWIPID